MNSERSFREKLGRTAHAHLLLGFALVSALLFLSAGTVRYWQAWIYLTLLSGTASAMVGYLLKHSPALLERRLRMQEKDPRQRWIIAFSCLWFLAAFLTPGFDRRFGWSDVPGAAVIAADLVILAGYGIVFRVFRENPFASRIIEVAPEQTVVSTGPYAVVRHPMYSGGLLIYLFTPLALGSYWAILPTAFIVPIIIARIKNEESLLSRDLKGYREYLRRTPYRLVPGVW